MYTQVIHSDSDIWHQYCLHCISPYNKQSAMKAQHTDPARNAAHSWVCLYAFRTREHCESITIALLAWFLIISRLFFSFFLIYIYKNLALAVYFRLINSDGRAHETGSIVIALGQAKAGGSQILNRDKQAGANEGSTRSLCYTQTNTADNTQLVISCRALLSAAVAAACPSQTTHTAAL
jgi:hypothetical protein